MQTIERVIRRLVYPVVSRELTKLSRLTVCLWMNEGYVWCVPCCRSVLAPLAGFVPWSLVVCVCLCACVCACYVYIGISKAKRSLEFFRCFCLFKSRQTSPADNVFLWNCSRSARHHLYIWTLSLFWWLSPLPVLFTVIILRKFYELMVI